MIDTLFDFFMEKCIPVLVMGFFAALVLAVPFGLYTWYKDSQSPTFALRKDSWACSASVERSTTTYVQSGNVMVPITTYYKHCTQWTELP